MLVSREFSFEAAHELPAHPGRCRHLHGHGYRLRVTLRAPVDPETGLAIDFGDVKRVVRERVLDTLDHAHLNDILPLPTAEMIAVWIWDRLVEGGLDLHEIEVHETAACSVVYRGEGLGDPGA